ncbi:MAG: P-II family nitrogen regulator, partial [Pseudomonadota bacterium]|nr:P-II family nitrogen regulator [Pseudomonadota bacterium]
MPLLATLCDCPLEETGSPTVGHSRRNRNEAMKKIEAIIKPFKLDEVKEALHEVGIQGIT